MTRRSFGRRRHGARHITMLLMLIALILLASFLFKRSHIAVITHHPMLWAVLLWSVGHLFANGSAADLVLFGAFLVWSAADLASSYARDRRNGIVYPAPQLGATVGAIVVGLGRLCAADRRPAPLAVWRVAARDVRRNPRETRERRRSWVAQAKH